MRPATNLGTFVGANYQPPEPPISFLQALAAGAVVTLFVSIGFAWLASAT